MLSNNQHFLRNVTSSCMQLNTANMSKKMLGRKNSFLNDRRSRGQILTRRSVSVCSENSLEMLDAKLINKHPQ